MVQIFALFADGLIGYRENKNSKSLNVHTSCGLNTEKARKLKPRKILLEFAPAKISHYTVA